MELPRSNGPVTVVGGGKSVNFGIAANGKTFRLLSDTLYQDKIGSIVRELSCNALDSHIAAGCPDKPFYIHLPDQFEPWFIVRDYGVGMSPDAIESVFCIYGESTKDRSNDAIGAFGLGAKTPFAYSDQFNVVSIFNGVKYAYSAFVNASGLPEMQLMEETPTDEGNGVEIRMGVKVNDFSRFVEAVRNQLRFFPVKPNVENFNNGAPFVWNEIPNALFESDNIRIFEQRGYYSRLFIVQGPVGYPLDYNQVVGHLTPDQSAFLRMIANVGASLYFNIGEIGVTASREGVEYTEFTLNNIKAKLDVAHKELVDWISGQLTNLPNVFEKAKFINDNSVFRNVINGITLDLSPAEKFSSGQYGFTLGNSEGFTVDAKRTAYSGDEVTYKKRLVNVIKYTKNSTDGFRASRNATDNDIIIPESNHNMVIAIRDVCKTPVARMRHYFQTNNLTHMYVLQPVDDSAVIDDKFIKALVESIGGFNAVIRVSQMPDVPKVAYDRTRETYARPCAYKHPRHVGMQSTSDWVRVYGNLTEHLQDNDITEALYVKVERQRILDVDYVTENLYDNFVRAGVDIPPVYAVRTNEVDKLADTGIKWTSLKAYVEAKAEEIRKDMNIRRHVLATEIKSAAESAIGRHFLFLKEKGIKRNLPLAKLLRIHERCENILKRSNISPALRNMAGYDASNHPAVKVVQARGSALYDKTPLVQHIGRYGLSSDAEKAHLVEYINAFGA